MSESIYPIISRAEAKSQGLKYFFTGKTCKHNHRTQRFVSSGSCCSCDKIAYTRNKQARSLYYAQYRAEHIIEVNARNKAWRLSSDHYNKNKELISINNKNWRKSNPHKLREHSNLRNTKLERQIPAWYEGEKIKQLYQKRDDLNRLWGTDFQVDHIIPLSPKNQSVCGLHCWSNLQLLDKSLNGSKNDRYETDW